jgi:hypothetical protein
MRRTLLVCAVLAACAAAAAGRDARGGFLTVRASAPGVRVMIDSLAAVAAPVDSLPIPSGTVVLRLLPARTESWSEQVAVETLFVAPGELVVRDAASAGLRRVSSDPYGAKVYARDSLLGTTPLFLPARMEGQILRMTRDGYEDALAPLAGDLHLALVPLAGAAPSFLAASPLRSMTPVYLSAGAGVLTGAAAAYFKIKADARYADYRSSGSAADLRDVRNLDRWSSISLAMSEMALFVLAYQLFSR